MFLLVARAVAAEPDAAAPAPAGTADSATEPATPPVGTADSATQPAVPPEEAAAEAEETVVTAPIPGQCAPDDPHYDLEVLYADGKYDEGLALARQRIAEKADKDLYWMAARFMYEVGERFQRTDKSIDKEAWYQEMLDLCDAGLAMAPGDPHLRFARGIAMGRLGTTRGVLSSLFMADDVEGDWLAVAEHPTFRYVSLGDKEELPCDAYHALGIYYRLVPDWWIVQVLAGTRGDLDKSVAWHQKSVQCKPDEIQNWKELGATQLCIGEKRGDAAMTEAGMASLRKVATLPANSPRKQTDRKHSQMMIDDPSLACEYSRDGQQDLDEGKLQK